MKQVSDIQMQSISHAYEIQPFAVVANSVNTPGEISKLTVVLLFYLVN